MSPDYIKTKKLLEVFNTSIMDQGLDKKFYFETYNMWASFQMSLFSEIKLYTSDAEYHVRVQKSSIVKKIQSFGMQIIFAIITLTSLIYLYIRKPKMLLYSIDTISDAGTLRDSRISVVYEFLKSSNIRVFEIMHTIPQLKTLKYFFKRKQPVVYLESLRFLGSSVFFLSRINTSADTVYINNYQKHITQVALDKGITTADAHFLAYLFKKYWAKAKQERITIRTIQSILKRFSFEKFWSIDDMRNIWEILIALDTMNPNIDSVVFQHGHYTKYHVGFLKDVFIVSEIAKPKKIVVWNEYWKQELLRLGSLLNTEQIFVGGGKKNPTLRPFKDIEHIQSILIPFETDAPKMEVGMYIKKFLDEGRIVYFKLRRDIDKGKQLTEYGLSKDFHKNFRAIVDESEVLDQIDVVAGVYSTYLYDSLYIGVPVLILNTTMDYGEGMITNGLAVPYEIQDELDSILGNMTTYQQRVVEYFKDSKRLADMIETIYND